MKYRIILLCLALIILPVMSLGSGSDIETHRDCKHCGMDRKQFGYSRMLISYADGTASGTCSLNCIVTDMAANKGKKIASIQVADRDSHTLIDVNKAFWVVGGSKRGVMSARAKWAFETKAAAEKFIAQHGGKYATWEEALQAAKDDAAPKPHKH